MALGISHGSQTAGLRFRAENAHRLPTSPTGWYLYHKTIEDMCDRWRGRKDVVNTVVASLSVAGGFSLWNRFPITTAARTAKTGLAFGIAYGLVQDAVGYARGRRLGYVDFITGGGGGRGGGKGREEEKEDEGLRFEGMTSSTTRV
ncbi:hypothetical protein EYC84_003955 [Monilinia fructicola]|uniref:Uncharacterized protein n=1 Tax=Monilinia fructicola TaxID=38448 RepID=A0A5M9K7A7_MONFR|nr:hypothetical protein EYC84_003955 [Monilinia fructicola]